MFKAVYDRPQPIDLWLKWWLKGDLHEMLPILFEKGAYYSPTSVDNDIARELYRELILNKRWELLNCYGDFIAKCDKEIGGVERNLIVKSYATLGYRKCTYDPSEDLKMFSERNLCKECYGLTTYLFTYPKHEIYVGENEKKLGKARSLYFSAKTKNKDSKKEKLLLKSASLGYVPAYQELGFLYEGLGREEECLKWQEEGAKHFDVEALNYLSTLYKGTDKEYQYLEKLTQIGSVHYLNKLLRLVEIIENEIYHVNCTLSESERKEKEQIIFTTLARIILEYSDIAEDKAEEVNLARLTLARLILEKKLALDGVFACVLVELSGTTDERIIKLVDSYREQEIARIRKALEGKINSALDLINKENGKKQALEYAKKQELERARQEEEARLQMEKAMHEARLKAEAEAREKAKQEEAERKQFLDPLNLNKNAEYNRKKGERIATYTSNVELYKKALATASEEEVVKAVTLAGESGHPKAMEALARYYHRMDEDKAKQWLELADEWGYADSVLNSKGWKWDTERCLLYISSDREYISRSAYEALNKIGIKKLSTKDIERLKVLTDKGNHSAMRIYVKCLKGKNPAEWSKYIYKLAYAGDENAIAEIIKGEGDISLNSSKEYVEFLKNEKVQENEFVKWQWYKILSSEELAPKFNKTKNDSHSLKHLFELDKCVKDSALKKAVRLELARCHEYGIGTLTNYWMASKYYRGYDNTKADYFMREHDRQNKQTAREIKVGEIMAKYPCAELDKMLSADNDFAKKIVEKYATIAPEKLEDNLKWRDEYLRFGFTLSEMYDTDGTFKEYQTRGAYLRKKAEIEAEKERQRQLEAERERQRKLALAREQEAIRLSQAKALAEKQKAVSSQTLRPATTTNSNSNTPQNTNKLVSKATKKQQEEEAIAKVRAKYGYVEKGNYSEQLEYFFKICQSEETCGKAYKLKDDPEALGKLYGVSPERVISTYDFAFLLKQKIEKVVGCCPEVEPGGIYYGVDYYKYAERDLAGLPCYGKALNLTVSFVQDIRYNNITTAPTSMDLFYDEYQKFHADEISKFVDFSEYARKSGLNYAVYSLEREEVSNGKSAARKITRAIAKELLKHYVVTEYTAFGTRKGLKKYYYGTLLIPTSLDITFNFWGND